MAISNQVTIHPNDIDDGWISIYYPAINNICEPLGLSTVAVFNWILAQRIHRLDVVAGKILGCVGGNRFEFPSKNSAPHWLEGGLMYG